MTPLATNNLQTEIITGNIEPIQGWVSFFSGEKQPAPAVRHRQIGTVPVQFCTLIYPYTVQNIPSVSLLDVKQDNNLPTDEGNLTGLQIEADNYVDYLIVDRNPTETRKFFCGYETDSQLVYIHHKKENNNLVAKKIFVKNEHQLLFKGQPYRPSTSNV